MPHQPTLRVLKILELLAHFQGNLSQISKKLDIPVGTLSPILQTLQENNYIGSKDKNYHLSKQILKLSLSIKAEFSAFELIKKHMIKIRDLSKQTCQLGILKGGEVLYLEKLEAHNAVQIKSFVGTSYPAYATSLGKALLQKKSKKELHTLYPKKLEKITPNTLEHIDTLYKQLQGIKKSKIALESGEMNTQIECMAIGLEHRAKIIAAISISYLIFDSNTNFRKKNEEILLKQKAKIEEELKLYFPELERL